MGVGERHSFFGQLVDERRLDLATIWIEALDVADSQVIAKNQDDVGVLLVFNSQRKFAEHSIGWLQ